MVKRKRASRFGSASAPCVPDALIKWRTRGDKLPASCDNTPLSEMLDTFLEEAKGQSILGEQLTPKQRNRVLSIANKHYKRLLANELLDEEAGYIGKLSDTEKRADAALYFLQEPRKATDASVNAFKRQVDEEVKRARQETKKRK